MFELTKQFRFEAAHTLKRAIETESSRRIHGHSYRAEVSVRGEADQDSGMVLDLGLLDRTLLEAREELDHRFLDEVAELGPATLENLSVWIWNKLSGTCPGLYKVSVHRDSAGETCSYYGGGNAAL